MRRRAGAAAGTAARLAGRPRGSRPPAGPSGVGRSPCRAPASRRQRARSARAAIRPRRWSTRYRPALPSRTSSSDCENNKRCNDNSVVIVSLCDHDYNVLQSFILPKGLGFRGEQTAMKKTHS